MENGKEAGPSKGGAQGKKKPSTVVMAPMFKIMKDRNGFEYKVANIENPVICLRRGIIEIEAIKRGHNREADYSFSHYTDHELGIHYGIPDGVNEKSGKFEWKRFRISDNRRYDLSNHQDAIEWMIFQRSPKLAGGINQRGKPMFKKYDREAEAVEFIQSSKYLERALEVIKGLKFDEYPDMIRNLGGNPQGMSATMMLAEIGRKAQKDPKNFLQVRESVSAREITVFNRCKSVGIIAFDLTMGSWMYKKGTPLGSTEDAAIQYLVSNPQLMLTADQESKNMSGDVSEAKAKQLAEEDEDVEFMNLKVEAKQYGVTGYNDKSKEDLRSIVEDFRAQHGITTGAEEEVSFE